MVLQVAGLMLDLHVVRMQVISGKKNCWFCLKNPNAAELSESATASNVLPYETTADRDGSEHTKTSVGVSLLRHHRAFLNLAKIYFRPAPMLLVEREVGPTVCPASDTGILSQRYPVPHKLTHQQKPRPRCRLIEHDFELLWITAAGAKTLSGIRNLPIDCAMFHNETVPAQIQLR